MNRRATAADLELFVSCGLHCFPLVGKRPIPGSGGWKDATTDLSMLLEMIRRHPEAGNVGLQPGMSGLVVIDFDDHKGPAACPAFHRLIAYAEQYGGLPNTLEALTGSGGSHLYFRANPRYPIGQLNGIRNPETGKIEAGVDVRGTAGYVVAPPSIHPNGNAYAWKTNSGGFEPDQIAELPDWLALWLKPPRSEPAALDRPEHVDVAMPDDANVRRVEGIVAARCRKLAALREGESRRTAIQEAAYYLGGLLWTGYPAARLRAELIDAAIACGKWNADTQRVLDFGIQTGAQARVDLPPDSPGWTPRTSSRRQIQRSNDAPQGEQGGPVGDVPTQADEELRYQTTPDGRPYIVSPPGNQNGWFVALPGGGFSFIKNALLRQKLERLWPDLETTYTTGGENPQVKAMGSALLWKRYGADASAVFYTYLGESRFNPSRGDCGDLYVRVPALVREVPAVRHADVLEWLQVMCADQYEPMLDWLSTAPRLDLPTSVPVLIGDSGCGKSMLSFGVARYFGPAVTTFDGVTRNQFNDALLRSPVAICDEESTTGARSGVFRSLSANSRHAVEPKNQPSGTLIGNPRLFFNSNEDDAMKISRENLSARSEKAIGDRILLVECAAAATQWLVDRGGRDGLTAEWVDRRDGSPGKIAELVSWLYQNRDVKLGGRLAVHGDSARWARRVSVRQGMAGTVLDALSIYLSWDSSQREALPAHPFLFDDRYPGQAVVFNQKLRECWRDLLGEAPPNHKVIAAALSKIGGGEPATKRTLSNGKRPKCSLIPLDLIPDWDGPDAT